ncbi:MAG: hypothetical protein ACFUZC_02790 [Chthoniobacteraceae bacterium]
MIYSLPCSKLLRQCVLSIVLLNVVSAATPGSQTSLPGFIEAAVREGKTKVVLPPGTYRMDAPLLLRELKDIEIDGSNVLLVMNHSDEALKIEKCDNVTVRGVSLDYDPLPFTQGTIQEVSPDHKTATVVIHEGYPPLGADLKTAPRHIFDRSTRRWKDGANIFASPVIERSADGRTGVVRFSSPQNALEAGDLMAFDRRMLDPFACIGVKNSGAVTFEDVTLHASPGLAICVRYGKGQTTLRRVKITPGPKPVGATEERLLSTNADGANFAYCRKGPLIEECDFSFMGDDSVNVHGLYLPVVRVDSPTTLRVVRPGLRSEAVSVIRPGDTLRVMEAETFAVVGRVKVASLEALKDVGDVTAEEAAKLYPRDAIAKNAALPYTVYRVVTAEPLPQAAPGQWLDVPDVDCPDYTIRNNYFHDHRARALRLMANGGVVEGNRIERIGSAAIQVGGEIQYWRESGWVETLRISNNHLRDIGVGGDLLLPSSYTPGAIVVCGRTDRGKPPYYPGNRDIVIEGNDIEGCPLPGIYAYAVTGLSILDNRIARVNLAKAPEAGVGYGLQASGGAARPAIVLGPNVEKAMLKGNKTEQP